VFVLSGSPKAEVAPFWKGEENGRDFHFSNRIGQFLEEADGRLDAPDFSDSLERKCCMDGEAISELLKFLKEQKEVTGCSLPHRHHVVVEFASAGQRGTSQAASRAMGRPIRPPTRNLCQQ